MIAAMASGIIALFVLAGWVALNVATDENPEMVFCWLGVHKMRQIHCYGTPHHEWYQCMRCGKAVVRARRLTR